MLKPNISFKTKKWTCKHCGLLKDISKWRIKIGDSVFLIRVILIKTLSILKEQLMAL